MDDVRKKHLSYFNHLLTQGDCLSESIDILQSIPEYTVRGCSNPRDERTLIKSVICLLVHLRFYLGFQPLAPYLTVCSVKNHVPHSKMPCGVASYFEGFFSTRVSLPSRVFLQSSAHGLSWSPHVCTLPLPTPGSLPELARQHGTPSFLST